MPGSCFKWKARNYVSPIMQCEESPFSFLASLDRESSSTKILPLKLLVSLVSAQTVAKDPERDVTQMYLWNLSLLGEQTPCFNENHDLLPFNEHGSLLPQHRLPGGDDGLRGQELRGLPHARAAAAGGPAGERVLLRVPEGGAAAGAGQGRRVQPASLSKEL